MVSSSLTSRYAVSCTKPVAKPGAIQINCRSFIRFEWSGAICPSTPRFPPRQRRRMVDVVLSEILAVPAERSRGRHNPRVVKRKMSNFPTKSRAVPNPLPSQRIHYEDLAIHQIPDGPCDTQYAVAMPEKCPYMRCAPHDMNRVGCIGISTRYWAFPQRIHHIFCFLGFSGGFFGGNR